MLPDTTNVPGIRVEFRVTVAFPVSSVRAVMVFNPLKVAIFGLSTAKVYGLGVIE